MSTDRFVLYGILALVFLLIIVIFLARSRKKQKQLYPENEQLYIGNLSYHVNAHQLRNIFSQYGELQAVRLIKNPRTGRSKGFAFVTYANVRDARQALSLNGERVQGRPIVVRMAKPRSE